jgi:hypothetical protein
MSARNLPSQSSNAYLLSRSKVLEFIRINECLAGAAGNFFFGKDCFKAVKSFKKSLNLRSIPFNALMPSGD